MARTKKTLPEDNAPGADQQARIVEAAARLFDDVLVPLPGREHADAYVLKQLRVRMPVGVRRVEGGGSVDDEGVYA